MRSLRDCRTKYEMPRNARIVAAGLPYHITQRGTNRERVFFTLGDRALYLQLIRENQEEAGVRVLAYCLMTNHVHFVVVPSREDSLALLFGRANGRYAQAMNIRKGRSGHLWQARYHSCVMSESHLWIGLRYVEANPVRAGLVKDAADYRWSSAAAHLVGKPDRSRVLDLEFWERAGGATTWAEMHAAESRQEQLLALRKCTYAGRPFGHESFVTSMEGKFQRKWRKGPAYSVAEVAMTA
jgi:putative transposase